MAPVWDELTTSGTGDDIFVDTTTTDEVTIRWNATHEPRATNKAADALANLALDDPGAAARLEAKYRA